MTGPDLSVNLAVNMSSWHLTILLVLGTIGVYQLFAIIQKKLNATWFNPMLLSILVIASLLLMTEMSFEQYYANTHWLNAMLEPAVVALGFPLYQHQRAMKHSWRLYITILALGVFIAISLSFILTITIIKLPEIAVSLSYKAVTTPIGIALTQEANGNIAVTAFAIILAGLFGALLGPWWLNHIGVKSAKAQGLAIGSASHALGTSTISNISYEHGAYGSFALIVSAVITAIIGPVFVSIFLSFFG